MNEHDFGDPFRGECLSPEGRALGVLIELFSDKMVQASLDGRPALSAVIPEVPLRLAEKLKERNSLMQAFGHMAWLEMRQRGLTEQGVPMMYGWPDIRRESNLQTFQKPC